MLTGLWHRAIVGSNDKHPQINPMNARNHIIYEFVMSGDIDKSYRPTRIQFSVSKAQTNGQTASFFFFKSISVHTGGEGIEELQAYLDEQAHKAKRNSSFGYFRLSIDRAFLIKGAGLVVTGTITSGSVKVGDTLNLVPRNINVRIRSLYVHDKQCEQAIAGQRCALNISGNLGKDEIERGDWLVDTRSAFTTMRFDGRVSILADAVISLKHMAPVRFFTKYVLPWST